MYALTIIDDHKSIIASHLIHLRELNLIKDDINKLVVNLTEIEDFLRGYLE